MIALRHTQGDGCHISNLENTETADLPKAVILPIA